MVIAGRAPDEGNGGGSAVRTGVAITCKEGVIICTESTGVAINGRLPGM